MPLSTADAPSGATLSQPDGTLVWSDAGFTAVCGYTRAELHGRSPGSVLQGLATDPLARRVLHDARLAQRSARVEIQNYHRDGPAYVACVHLQPVRNTVGDFIGILSFVRDVSAELEEQHRPLFLAGPGFGILDEPPLMICPWTGRAFPGGQWVLPSQLLLDLHGHALAAADAAALDQTLFALAEEAMRTSRPPAAPAAPR